MDRATLEAMGINFTAGLDRTPVPPTPAYDSPSVYFEVDQAIEEVEQAAIIGDLSAVKVTLAMLRAISPRNDGALLQPGSSLLFAIENGHEQVVGFLFSERVTLGDSHVKLATNKRNIPILASLLQHGWKINDELAWATPPALAFAIEDLELTTWFLAHGADPMARCLSGLSPFNVAMQFAPFPVIEMLFAHGASVNASDTLVHAVRRDAGDQVNLLNHLLDRGGRSVINELMYEKIPLAYQLQKWFALGTPLHEAGEHGKLDVAKLLVGNGADFRIKDSLGETALERARRNKHDEVVHYLQQLNRKPTSQL